MDGIIIGSSPAEGAIDFYYDLIQHYCLTPRSLPRRVLKNLGSLLTLVHNDFAFFNKKPKIFSTSQSVLI